MIMTKIEPTISVVIPTYNRKNLLKEAIQSVLDQTYQNFELIIVDNFSADGTEKMVEDFKNSKLIFKKINNKGVVAKSRNHGVRVAKGNYIAFLDSDDKWAKNKLEKCVSFIKEGFDFIYHDFTVLQYDKHKKIKARDLKHNGYHDLLKRGNCIFNSSVVLKKEHLETIGYISENIEHIGCEDFITWLKIAKKGWNPKYVPYSLGIYNLDDNNLSTAKVSEINAYALQKFLEEDIERLKVARYPQWLGYKLCKSLFDQSKFYEFENNLKLQYFYHWNFMSIKLLYMLITSKIKNNEN